MSIKNILTRKNSLNAGRRHTTALLLKTMALLPFAGLVKIPVVFAEELPRLKNSDPTAKALKYLLDANNAERPEKAGIPGEQQNCSNCHFIVGESGQWRPCRLFPVKQLMLMAGVSAGLLIHSFIFQSGYDL